MPSVFFSIFGLVQKKSFLKKNFLQNFFSQIKGFEKLTEGILLFKKTESHIRRK